MRIIIILILLTILGCGKTKSTKKTLVKEVTKVVVVQKISLSYSSSYQNFIVSGKGFKFQTIELTFGIGDTIVIKGDYIYPKKDSILIIKKYQ